MLQYVFILGREPALSVAEIKAVAARQGVRLVWNSLTTTAAILEKDKTFDFFDNLAGTVKVAEVLGSVVTNKEDLTDFLSKKLPANERCEFGLSFYGPHPPKWLLALGLAIKNNLKSNGQHVRYVTARTAALSSVVVQKNKLLPPTGFEFILLPEADKMIISRTVSVQDFESWSARDYGRPERDARVGMLPPKLARLMVNLAQAPEGAGILDPFCGSGTVLQEAALLGYRHLVGADVESQGIERTRVNFSWLKERQPQLALPALMVADVSKLPAVLSNSTFEAIVTEPYLGPPLRGHESLHRLEQISKELTEFYQGALKVMANLVKSGGRVVMVWPVWRASGKNLTLPLLDKIKELDFKQVDVLPPAAPASWRNSRNTLWYSRSDSRLIREIVVLEKQ